MVRNDCIEPLLIINDQPMPCSVYDRRFVAEFLSQLELRAWPLVS
jgi:hypothetical protein